MIYLKRKISINHLLFQVPGKLDLTKFDHNFYYSHFSHRTQLFEYIYDNIIFYHIMCILNVVISWKMILNFLHASKLLIIFKKDPNEDTNYYFLLSVSNMHL